MVIIMERRIRAFELFLRSDGSFSKFRIEWVTKYGEEPHPGRKYMYKLLKKFRSTGSLQNLKRNRIRTVRNENVVTDIAAYFDINQGMSLRSFLKEENYALSKSTLRKILKEDLNLKPYKCRKFQHLKQGDNIQRYNMCTLLLDLISNDVTFLSKIIWTDECFFKLNATRNTHNIRWWSRENPHIYVEKVLNAAGVMVFMGVSIYGPIGPFFFDELKTNAATSAQKKNKNSVSGQSYKEMLLEKIIPEINAIFPPEIREQFFGKISYCTESRKKC